MAIRSQECIRILKWGGAFLASLAYFATFSHGKLRTSHRALCYLFLVSIQGHFFQTPKPNELLFRVHFHLEKEQFIPVTLYFDP